MSKFLEDLWESIFTPGPTPSLLIATNATFAVLQVVLFVLLLATYSIHFVILSFLSGGLWWAINWFARELKSVQLRQEQVERDETERARKQQRRVAAVAAAAAASVSTDSETEVEGTTPRLGSEPARTTAVDKRMGSAKQRLAAGIAQAAETAQSAPVSVEKTPLQTTAAAAASDSGRQTNTSLSGSRSGVSTEDEWEKVSETENDKDR